MSNLGEFRAVNIWVETHTKMVISIEPYRKETMRVHDDVNSMHKVHRLYFYRISFNEDTK